MKILAIETSCDETSAAVVEADATQVILLSNVVASSLALHAQTGGIIPERAAREQIKFIIPVIAESLEKAGLSFDISQPPAIDALAVTYGPGLIGSLLVGVESIKTLACVWNKPLIPVNHLFGHIYANWIGLSSAKQHEGDRLQKVSHSEAFDKGGTGLNSAQQHEGFISTPDFPLIALIVSGGHTDLLLMKSHTDITWLGGTRDDAAGEAFDKIGRLLNLPYPAGPKIEMLAKEGSAKKFHFPRPLIHDKGYDFSFSGLKTAVLREVQKIKTMDEQTIKDLCRGVQDAITDVLVTKTLKAVEEFQVNSILLSGGVAANQTLRDEFIKQTTEESIHFFVPPKNLCTDNAAMIGAAAYFRNQDVAWNEISANPELYFD